MDVRSSKSRFGSPLSDDENRELNQVVIDCNGEVMNQFIKFIYTGEFDGFFSQELVQVAVKYDIKTLEDLCQTAPKKASLNDITKFIPWNLESGSSDIDLVLTE